MTRATLEMQRLHFTGFGKLSTIMIRSYVPYWHSPQDKWSSPSGMCLFHDNKMEEHKPRSTEVDETMLLRVIEPAATRFNHIGVQIINQAAHSFHILTLFT